MTSPNTPPKSPSAADTNSFKTVTEASTTSPAARASLDASSSSSAASTSQSTSGSGGSGELADKAKAEASKVADKAKSAAESGLEGIKGEATQRIDETASHIRSAGREFGDDSYQAQAADYLADNLIEAADRIRAQDLDSMTREATAFARSNPTLVLGGAALLGFAVARLLKASEHGGRA